MIYHAPKPLNELSTIKVGITYAKRESFNQAGSIAGLNFGEKNGASKLILKRNLDILTNELGHNGQIALAEQVHGADISVVNGPGYYSEVDGLVTSVSDLLLGIKVADCAAILMSDPHAGVIAAVHAGWRGAASGILPNSIRKMQEEGASVEHIQCYISPCISLQNFEIGKEVADQFPSEFIDRKIGKKPHLNLKAFLKQQMIDAGISTSSITVDSRCTIDDTSFYSFRRERDDAGRMLAFIRQTDNKL